MKLPLKKWILGGYRFSEPTFYNTKHGGTDLKADFEPLYASVTGTAIKYSDMGGGKWIFLRQSKIQFRFAHLSEYKKIGDVQEGEQIAITGNSGKYTTNPHLHFEVLLNGTKVNPENYMFRNILIANNPQKPISKVILSSVMDWFSNYGIFIMFFETEQIGIEWWMKMVITVAGPSWCDTLDTYHTPYYDAGFSWADVYGTRKPENILIHEILHAFYQDAKLNDIHDYNWGVTDNIKVVEYLIKNKEMRYVILGINQYLLSETPKVAFTIPDEEALKEFQSAGLVGMPEIIQNLDGYLIYRGAFDGDWKRFLNL